MHKLGLSVSNTLFLLDIALVLLFVVVMSVHYTGIALHEWLSFVFLIPFALHLLFHWEWITTMPYRLFGSLRGEVRFNVVLDLALYLVMTFAIVSGILASEVALAKLGFDIQPDPFWSKAHHDYSTFLYVLVGIHIAMHWQWIIKVSQQIRSTTEPTGQIGPRPSVISSAERNRSKG